MSFSKNRTLSFRSVFLWLLFLLAPVPSSAFDRIAGFMPDPAGEILRIDYLEEKKFTLGRGFPLCDVGRGLILRGYNSGKEHAPLVQGMAWAHPRFSPNGSRVAFFARPQKASGGSWLFIQSIDGKETRQFEMEKRAHEKTPPSGRNLAWSPSGRLLAGVVFANRGYELCIWDAETGLIGSHLLPFRPGFYWVPLWSAGESEILLFDGEPPPGVKWPNGKFPGVHRIRIG